MKQKTKKKIGMVLIYVAVAVLLIWTLSPVLWMIMSSVTPKSELLVSTAIKLPEVWTFDRYKAIFSGIHKLIEGGRLSAPEHVFFHGLINSLIITLSTTALALFFGGLASYAFARLKFRFKDFLLLMILFVQLLPAVSLVIPLYKIVGKLGMIDHLSTLIVINLAAVMAYVIWVLNGYYRSIPQDLEAAARIDGCTHFQAFLRIVFPLAKPGFVAVGTLSFLMSWDEFFYALIFLNSPSSKTFTVAMTEFSTKTSGLDYPLLMTGGCIASLIPLCLALFFQKYIVMGLTAGSEK